MYPIKNKVQEVDARLCKMESPRYKYISYRNTISKKKLATMYHNDKKNRKVK